MPQGYQIGDPRECHFLTLQVVDWVDVFTRERYRKVLVESLAYCRQAKGLHVYGYVMMSNHVHLLLHTPEGNLSDVLRDFKAFTSKRILNLIETGPESRREWMMTRFAFAARNNQRASDRQFWTHENHAMECTTEPFFFSKLDYIHQNPVRAGLVEAPEHYLYSSARNYHGLSALLDIDPY